MRTARVLLPLFLGLLITFGIVGGLAQASIQAAVPMAPTADIIYVDADAAGAATGIDWTNAYTNLQDALAIAINGDEIWVAEGVYYPDEGSSQSNNIVTSTFVLTDGVAIFGGFDPGSGADEFAERAWETYVTVLSGDIDGNDITDPHGVVTHTTNISGTNAYHVVSSSGLTATAVIDGFYITAGSANGSLSDNCGGGMFNNISSPTLSNLTITGNRAGNLGGGMYNEDSHPILTNVTFSQNTAFLGGGTFNYKSNPTLKTVAFFYNTATFWGGGMYNDNSNPAMYDVIFSGNFAEEGGGGGMLNESSSPGLTNVTFINNSTYKDGGGMYNVGDSNPMLTGVTFAGNSAGLGGGVYNIDSFPMLLGVAFYGNSANLGGGMYNYLHSHPVLTNVIFSGNSADDGGGIYNHSSDPTLTNVTFSGNSADGGSGIYNHMSDPKLTNTILWGNLAGSQGGQIFNDRSSPTIDFSDIQDCGGSSSWVPDCGTDDGYNIDADPLFVRDPDPGPDGNWDGVDDDYGDLHLKTGSPAIDKGTNVGCPAADLDGNPRPIGFSCDMGAHERQNFKLEIAKLATDLTPVPGQTVTFTVVVNNPGPGVNGGLISDTLMVGLNFLGPITLEPAESGLAGLPPLLASSLVISSGQRITVTFPVTISYGLTAGALLQNTAAVSSTEMSAPVQSSITLTVQNVPPMANDDGGIGFSTDEDSPFTTASVLTNDTDPNDDMLSLQSYDTSGTQGLVISNGDGTFYYDPNGQFENLSPDEWATDAFRYTMNDGHGGADTAVVTISIKGVQDDFYNFLPLVVR